MDQLKTVMHQRADLDVGGKLQPEKVMSYFTVQNLVDLVASRAATVSS
jgi:hypothetical protein